MKKWLRVLLVGVLMMGLVFAAVGCSSEGEPEAGNDVNTERQKIIVGTEATYSPFEMVIDGEYTGFDMDVIRAVAESQDYDVEITNLGFDALIPALDAGNIDCAIAAMTIDEERAKKVDFSNPYFDAGLIIAVKAETEGIDSLEDLQGKQIAAQVGTTGAAASQQVKDADPATEVKIFDSVGEAFMELEKGGVDAVINDHPVTADYITTVGDDKVKMVGEVFSTDSQYGIAVKKGNSELLDALNEGLAAIQANGEYDAIYEKWFE